MSGFSAQWLALREPYDVGARNAAVLDAVSGAFVQHASISVVDIGCGTGSTLRAIAGRLPRSQSWRLVDNDLGLLARAAALRPSPDIRVMCTPIDLVKDLEIALAAPVDLVTTSAFLDLVSLEWLDRFIIELAARRLSVYAALTYDGRAALEPPEALDVEVLEQFHAHLRADNGFGPALGHAAAKRAVERFEHFGYGLVQGLSDWVLTSADIDMQEAILAGWAGAGGKNSAVSSWLSRRRSHLAAGRLSLRLGHLDIFARPRPMR